MRRSLIEDVLALETGAHVVLHALGGELERFRRLIAGCSKEYGHHRFNRVPTIDISALWQRKTKGTRTTRSGEIDVLRFSGVLFCPFVL